VRHITPARLGSIDGLLVQLRAVEGLVERTPGAFYFKSRGFLHFHEDGDDLYADVKLSGDDFDRIRVTTTRERQALVASVRRVVKSKQRPAAS
jgi:hypothetical protein